MESGAAAVVNEGTGGTRLVTFDRDEVVAASFDGISKGSGLLTWIAFGDTSLAELGVPRGEVPLVETGADTRRLPLDLAGLRFFESRGGESWKEVATVSSGVQELSFVDPRPRRCPTLDERDFEVPGTTERVLAFTVALDDRRFLFGLDDGQVFLGDIDGAIEAVTLPGLEGTASGAFRAGERLWVGTTTGSVYRSSVSDPTRLERVLTSSAAPIDRLVVTTMQGRQETVVLDRERVLWRHDGAAWSRAYAFPLDGTADRSKDLIEIEPGHVLAVALSEPTLVRIREGTLSAERPETLPVSGFQCVAHLAGFGTIASGTFGELYSDHDSRWRLLMSPSLHVNVASLEPFGGLLALVSYSGTLELIIPEERRSCGPQPLPLGIRGDLLRVGEALVAVGVPRASGDAQVAIFTRK